jgi:sensor histidine kinase YesM
VGEYFVKDFAVFGILAVIINIFKPFYYYFDETNNYQRGEYFELGQILTMIPFFVVAFMIIHNRKQIGRNGFVAFISYVTFPAISILLTAGQYTRVSRLNIGISLALYFMVAIIISDQRRSIFEQRKAILNQEREINEMQIRLVISQIQPHFLYNSLNTIYYLCEKDVSLAQEAINNFSNYLRGNMNALGASKPVDFEVELNHVKNYLALEEMRFGEELEVYYDIETTDFKIPSLCLQPIVENAVKHGVGKKIGGGSVTIRVKELSDSYEVIVEDDGVGYNVDEKKDDGRTHVGIDNVKNRIEKMVHGSLFVKSEVGKGTLVVIHIPK